MVSYISYLLPRHLLHSPRTCKLICFISPHSCTPDGRDKFSPSFKNTSYTSPQFKHTKWQWGRKSPSKRALDESPTRISKSISSSDDNVRYTVSNDTLGIVLRTAKNTFSALGCSHEAATARKISRRWLVTLNPLARHWSSKKAKRFCNSSFCVLVCIVFKLLIIIPIKSIAYLKIKSNFFFLYNIENLYI